MVKHGIARAGKRAAGGLRLILAGGFGALALASAPATSADGAATPLFASDAPLDITISGPIRELTNKAQREVDPFPATLSANGETLPIQLSVRGHSRRMGGFCRFFPLRVAFTPKPAAPSLFDGQKTLKLVVHCQDNPKYDQYVLREYAVYRLYNTLTPESFRARLVHVTYQDGGKELTQRWAYFIEDTSDLARRVGRKEVEVPGIPSSALDPADAARATLFEYLIGNLDWDLSHGPEGTDCCHNSKLIGAAKESRTELTPVPYDFDYSGMVYTPYAIPPEGVPVSTVRNRYYRGLCRHNAAVQQAALEFIAARPKLEAKLAAIPQLAPKERDDMLKYLGGFYEDIATPAQIDKKLLKVCRGAPASS